MYKNIDDKEEFTPPFFSNEGRSRLKKTFLPKSDAPSSSTASSDEKQATGSNRQENYNEEVHINE